MRLVRSLKTAGKIIGLSILCLVVAGIITGIFYGKEIKQLIIAELNKNIDTKIHVEEFEFSVFRHFPRASFEMKNVVIEGVSDSNITDTLLYAGRLSLLFSITDVFRKDIVVKKVMVYDGNINIRINKEGFGNYHFWKTTNDTSASGVIDLEKIGLKKVYLRYIDKKATQDYAMLANDAELSVKFSVDEFSLSTKAELFIDKLLIHDVNYVDHKPVTILSGLHVNSKTGHYKFDESNITIAGVRFNLSGQITNEPVPWKLDLAIKGSESDIESLIKILPVEYKHYPEKYNTNGKFLFSSIIKGSIKGKSTPLVKIDFTVKNGTITSGNAEIEKLNFSGVFYSENNNKKSSIEIPALTASLSGHTIKGSIRLDNLPDAFITLHAQTQLDLKEIYPFIQADTLESLSGDLALNISYAGKVRELSELKRGQLNKIQASGNIDISHVTFRLKKNPLEFKNLSGNFSLHDNDVYIKNFTGNISSSDFRLDGVFKNFISFLLIPGQPGDMQAKLATAKKTY